MSWDISLRSSAAVAALAYSLITGQAAFPIPTELASILDNVPGLELYADQNTRRGSSNKTGLEVFRTFSAAYDTPAGGYCRRLGRLTPTAPRGIV